MLTNRKPLTSEDIFDVLHILGDHAGRLARKAAKWRRSSPRSAWHIHKENASYIMQIAIRLIGDSCLEFKTNTRAITLLRVLGRSYRFGRSGGAWGPGRGRGVDK